MTDRPSRRETGAGGLNPTTIQQTESGLIVAFSLTATITLFPSWWWFPLAAFLVFDLSALGYLRSSRTGAVCYNAIHTYAWPAVLGSAAFVTDPFSATLSMWLALVALAWAFHVGLDRMLGFGLKLPDAFTHTHLGWIGKDRDKNSLTGR